MRIITFLFLFAKLQAKLPEECSIPFLDAQECEWGAFHILDDCSGKDTSKCYVGNDPNDTIYDLQLSDDKVITGWYRMKDQFGGFRLEMREDCYCWDVGCFTLSEGPPETCESVDESQLMHCTPCPDIEEYTVNPLMVEIGGTCVTAEPQLQCAQNCLNDPACIAFDWDSTSDAVRCCYWDTTPKDFVEFFISCTYIKIKAPPQDCASCVDASLSWCPLDDHTKAHKCMNKTKNKYCINNPSVCKLPQGSHKTTIFQQNWFIILMSVLFFSAAGFVVGGLCFRHSCPKKTARKRRKESTWVARRSRTSSADENIETVRTDTHESYFATIKKSFLSTISERTEEYTVLPGTHGTLNSTLNNTQPSVARFYDQDPQSTVGSGNSMLMEPR